MVGGGVGPPTREVGGFRYRPAGGYPRGGAPSPPLCALQGLLPWATGRRHSPAPSVHPATGAENSASSRPASALCLPRHEMLPPSQWKPSCRSRGGEALFILRFFTHFFVHFSEARLATPLSIGCEKPRQMSPTGLRDVAGGRTTSGGVKKVRHPGAAGQQDDPFSTPGGSKVLE